MRPSVYLHCPDDTLRLAKVPSGHTVDLSLVFWHVVAKRPNGRFDLTQQNGTYALLNVPQDWIRNVSV